MPLFSFSLRKLWLRAKRRRPSNGQAPPSRPLPPSLHDEPQNAAANAPYELLHIIFSLAMKPSSSDIDYSEKTLLCSTILSISQVCRQWRSTALSDSSLWIHSIDFERHPPEAIAHFLRLSRPHLIDVGHRSALCRIYGKHGLAVVRALWNDFHRVKQWNIDLSPEFRWVGFHTLFGIPKTDDANSGPLHPVHTLRLTGVLTMASLHRGLLVKSLQKLSLRDTTFALTAAFDLSNLTELAIATMYRSVKYEIAEVIAILRRAPRLQFLGLRNAIAPGPRPIPLNQPLIPVHLPELRFISVSESQWQTAHPLLFLLSIIRRPLQCGLDISLPSSEESWYSLMTHSVDVVLERVRRSLHGASWPSPLLAPRVEISLQPHGFDHRLTIGTIPSSQDNLDWNGACGTNGIQRCLDDYSKLQSPTSTETQHPPLRITICNPKPLDVSTTAKSLYRSAFETTTSVRITIDLLPTAVGKEDTPIKPISRALCKMEQVKIMTLNEGAAFHILRTLRGRTYFNYSGVPVLVLPNLEYIAIEANRHTPEPSEQRVGMLRAIRRYVEWRRKAGLPVEIFWLGPSGDSGKEGDSGYPQRPGGLRRNGIVSMHLTTDSHIISQ
ncbi:hypothetical protein NMY22_g9756 [Coprinellus aureogranulatus]|nr:hypothetical protein NMY22_g9756 [Coprinellus aureogranulatus]